MSSFGFSVLTHWSRDEMAVIFADDIFKYIFFNDFRLTFHWSLLQSVQLYYLNQRQPGSLTHIYMRHPVCANVPSSPRDERPLFLCPTLSKRRWMWGGWRTGHMSVGGKLPWKLSITQYETSWPGNYWPFVRGIHHGDWWIPLTKVQQCAVQSQHETYDLEISGPLWGESTGDQWIPATKSRNAQCNHSMRRMTWKRFPHYEAFARGTTGDRRIRLT